MLRCAKCGQEEYFVVTETVRRVIGIEPTPSEHPTAECPGSYQILEILEGEHSITWETLRCDACQHTMTEAQARQAFLVAHGLVPALPPMAEVLAQALAKVRATYVEDIDTLSALLEVTEGIATVLTQAYPGLDPAAWQEAIRGQVGESVGRHE